MRVKYGVPPKKSVLVISPDAVPLCPNQDELSQLSLQDQTIFKNKVLNATSMGQRAWFMSNELAKQFNVTLAIPNHNYIFPKCINTSELFFNVVSYDYDKAIKGYSDDLQGLIDEYDIIIIQTSAVGFHNCIKLPKEKILVADGWIPLGIERCTSIGYADVSDEQKQVMYNDFKSVYFEVLRRANIILYANLSQKYYYLGILNALGDINHINFKHSKLLKINVSVPRFTPLSITYKKGDTFNLVWFGSSYPWYNPFILVEAFQYLRDENITLSFVGFGHPRFKRLNNEQLESQLSQNKNIRIIKEYTDITNLSGYHLAVILAYNFLESQVAHRYRSLQLGAVGLPVCTNKQDNVGYILERYDLYYPVLTSSPENLARSIIDIRNTYQAPAVSTIRNFQNSLTHERSFEPLVGFLLGEEKWKLI